MFFVLYHIYFTQVLIFYHVLFNSFVISFRHNVLQLAVNMREKWYMP